MPSLQIPAETAVAIRRAQPADAEAVSRLCISALIETNGRDYPAHVIARLVDDFAPAIMATRIANDVTVVAHSSDRLVGTAGLNGEVVKSLFVAPDAQGRGVGRALLNEIERLARLTGAPRLTLQSSITAQRFYESFGFTVVRESMFGDERTIVMQRML